MKGGKRNGNNNPVFQRIAVIYKWNKQSANQIEQ